MRDDSNAIRVARALWPEIERHRVLGNCSTRDVERVLRSAHEAVVAFEADAEASFLAVE